jgi:hypothetical protein
MSVSPNKADAPNPAIAPPFHLGDQWRRVGDPYRSPEMRAERAKPDWKKERLGWVRFTQGGGLGGLALGYYHTAPRGAPEAV